MGPRSISALPGPLRRRPRPGQIALALCGVLAASTLLLLGSPPSPALADDTMVGSIGGAVYPLESSDIRMEAETVQAVCYRGFTEYRVDFKFVNEGKPQTVKLGFPFEITESGDRGYAPVAFRAWQDDRPLDITIGQGVSGDELNEDAPVRPPLAYYLHEATFPHGETMITVCYFALPTVSAGSRFPEAAPPEFIAADIGGWEASYKYWLHTGAGWRGTIGKAVVRFRLADSFKGWGVDIKMKPRAEGGYPGRTTSPESYVKLDGRTYQWVFKDFEPTEENDILLAFDRPNLWPSPGQTVPASYGALASAMGASGDLGEAMADWPAGFSAIDGSPDSAWGVPAPGSGGWLLAGISGNQNLREIRILPGRNDSLSSFTDYGRPKTLKVTFSDGTSTVITLKDAPSLQKFAISGKAEWVRFDILDIYPGSNSDDTYISEIDFGNVPAPEFDTFANMIASGTPPTTEAPPATEGLPATVVPSTIQSPSTTVSAATTVSTESTVTAGGSATTGTTAAASPGGSRAGNSSGRLLWPAYVGAAVAAIGLAALTLLAARFRRARRADREHGATAGPGGEAGEERA